MALLMIVALITLIGVLLPIAYEALEMYLMLAFPDYPWIAPLFFGVCMFIAALQIITTFITNRDSNKGK